NICTRRAAICAAPAPANEFGVFCRPWACHIELLSTPFGCAIPAACRAHPRGRNRTHDRSDLNTLELRKGPCRARWCEECPQERKTCRQVARANEGRDLPAYEFQWPSEMSLRLFFAPTR